ncbi:MAG: 1,4-dihydroxy-2-naphthoate octaprenyltransferase [Deltaproteobacteria bacterium]|nr:1,4-dihydroxy-2-naphthoate octaprenyltransferase [Deltaproteobacteria bacterium]
MMQDTVENMSSRPHSLRVWFTAARPHTLSAGVVPVLVGGALAQSLGAFSPGLFALTLAGSVLVQVGANLTDEFADHGATASAHKFPAPHKVIARGLLSQSQVRHGALAVFMLATFIGSFLVWRTGWELLALCLASLAAAYFYSAGPRPLGDIALGEPLVFVMMGPVMVGGTLLVQLGGWQAGPLASAMWFSLPVGALVTAILVGNNLRDEDEDRKNGRRTLVTVLGAGLMLGGYYFLLALAFAVPALSLVWGWSGPTLLLPWLTLPLAVGAGRLVGTRGRRDVQHRGLKATSGLHAVFGLLLAAGLLLDT